jgi:hypothetical protein
MGMQQTGYQPQQFQPQQQQIQQQPPPPPTVSTPTGHGRKTSTAMGTSARIPNGSTRHNSMLIYSPTFVSDNPRSNQV